MMLFHFAKGRHCFIYWLNLFYVVYFRAFFTFILTGTVTEKRGTNCKETICCRWSSAQIHCLLVWVSKKSRLEHLNVLLEIKCGFWHFGFFLLGVYNLFCDNWLWTAEVSCWSEKVENKYEIRVGKSRICLFHRLVGWRINSSSNISRRAVNHSLQFNLNLFI